MIPHVPEKRRDGRSSFLQLVSYLILRDETPEMGDELSENTLSTRPSRARSAIFDRLVDYVDRQAQPGEQQVIATFPDGSQQVRCDNVLCQTNAFDLSTAALEMNAVAAQNTRCIDPVYHFILSWPEDESPDPQHIFESAAYCLEKLGMKEHQYVFAIHTDTDNIHCHVAVNRVHPVTYDAVTLYNDYPSLHKCCRELELRYDWKPDNGCWVRDENGHLVKPKRTHPPVPQGAKQLEYHEDKESLYTYAVRECRAEINALLLDDICHWDEIHYALLRANLELKPKGEGMAIYDRNDPEQTPIKASSLHPHMTLSSLTPLLGEFTPAPEYQSIKNETGQPLLENYHVDIEYIPYMHARDQDARLTRRAARAVAREKLKNRYSEYKKGFIKPSLDASNRFKTVAAEFRVRKAHVRVSVGDPLMRKLTYHVLEVEREKAMATLRMQLKSEKEALVNSAHYRRQTYRGWVERQAMTGDVAAISQLRGWAYKEKRKNRTAVLSDTVIQCAVADDIPAFDIDGYVSQVNRDGAIVYKREGKTGVIDRGDVLEVVRPFEDNADNLATALSLAEDKCGEKLVLGGSEPFIQQASALVKQFNAGCEKPLPLTDPRQRQLAGYGQPKPSQKPAEPERKPRPNNGPTPRP